MIYVRYAVPVAGGLMSPHFDHCEQLALIDVDEGRKEILKKELIPSPGHEPDILTEWLAEQGVSLVITSSMGSLAQSILQQNHIGVIIDTLGRDPEKAVLSYFHMIQKLLKQGANDGAGHISGTGKVRS